MKKKLFILRTSNEKLLWFSGKLYFSLPTLFLGERLHPYASSPITAHGKSCLSSGFNERGINSLLFYGHTKHDIFYYIVVECGEFADLENAIGFEFDHDFSFFRIFRFCFYIVVSTTTMTTVQSEFVGRSR